MPQAEQRPRALAGLAAVVTLAPWHPGTLAAAFPSRPECRGVVRRGARVTLAPRLLQWRGTASTAPTWGQAAMTWCGHRPVCASATLLPALRPCPLWHMTGALASCCQLLAITYTGCAVRFQGTKDARVTRATPILCLHVRVITRVRRQVWRATPGSHRLHTEPVFEHHGAPRGLRARSAGPAGGARVRPFGTLRPKCK